MRRLALLLAAVALPFALAATATAAAPVTTIISADGVPHLSPRFSNICGFPIYRTETGTFKETSFYDNSGTLLRVEDRSYGGPYSVTLTNPATGRSTTTQSSAFQSTFIYNPDGSLASLSRSGVFFNFTAPGEGTLLRSVGHEAVDVASDTFFDAGVNDIASGNTAALCNYLATP